MLRSQSLTTVSGIGPKRAKMLQEMGLQTVNDLLWFLPLRYVDVSQITPINELEANQIVTIHATVIWAKVARIKGRSQFVTAKITDETGTLTITFFNQPYIAKTLTAGEKFAFSGKASLYKNRITLTNPTVEKIQAETLHTGRIVPIYSQHEGIKTRWLRQTLFPLLKAVLLEEEEDIPQNLRQAEGLIEKKDAFWQAHFPDSLEFVTAARRRLAFEELREVFYALQKQKAEDQKLPAPLFPSLDLQKFAHDFSQASHHSLTESQKLAITALAQTLTQPFPQTHVVQGEVGSGKTLLAAFALCATALNGGTAFYIAPTTILAQQHWKTIAPLAEKLGLAVDLLTSQEKTNNDAKIFIGTHALFTHTQKQPAVVIVDEEHRFGVKQRAAFFTPERKPHLITMTATPIPRTLAHLLYGDQSVSFLEPIPGKEKKITTRVFPHTKLHDHFHWLTSQVQVGKQAFLVAPFINPSEAEGLTEIFDAESLFLRAKEEIPQAKIGLLTGNTPEKEKNALLKKMGAGELDILVATPVIEVGIDIPNASIITLFSAERFGLAQLHQLRGRVGRAGQESWCFLVPSPQAKNSERLKKLETLDNGSQLAELDLQNRGVGDFLGTQQSGWDTLRTTNWLDISLIESVKRVQKALNQV